jgi:predicted CopG family antitoxin
MQIISIDYILECMNDEKNYFGDLWQTCLNNKKRFNRTKLKEILKRMEVLGHIKKHGYKDDAYYVKYYHYSMEENIGFINNIIFTYESKINSTIKNLENRKIFVDISKGLLSSKFNKYTKSDYELLLTSMAGMFELASSILWTKENSDDEKLKKELKNCFKQINEFMAEINQRLLQGRGTEERILLQRDFTSKIPKAGHLKI